MSRARTVSISVGSLPGNQSLFLRLVLQVQRMFNIEYEMSRLRRKLPLFLLATIFFIVLYRVANRLASVRAILIERRCRKWPYQTIPARDEQSDCDRMLEIATAMLNGEKIQLPIDGKGTRWEFKKTVDLSSYNLTDFRWNYPWEQGNNKRTMEKTRYYNVSSQELPFKKFFLTFGESCCDISKNRAVSNALRVGGFDVAKAYDLCWVKAGFRRAHKDILFQRKGAGFWLWKPYIILRTLVEKMSFGDVLMYEDAGSYLIKDAGPLLKLASELPQGIVVFQLQLLEKYYTKRDTFVTMEMDYPEIDKSSYQTMGSFLALRKDCQTLQFVMEWLAYSSDTRCVTDDPNQMNLPNYSGFIGHRHDQSVLSLLSRKWGILQFRDPSNHGKDDWDFYGFASGPYEQLIVHDRYRY